MRWFVMAAVVSCVVGCGSPPPPAAPKLEASAEAASSSGAPTVESEVGALDEAKVKHTFQRATAKLYACFTQGAQRLAYLGGDVRFVVRVARDGRARWAYANDSTLGDHETERCMLDVLKAMAWPPPSGGEGLAESSFTFDPSADERPPMKWTPEQLGAPYRRVKGTLSKCRKKAGSKSLKATFYVETDGKPSAIGVSSADEHGEGAVACVIDILKRTEFPSPGSFASKVSITIE